MALARTGPLPLRLRPPGFAGLLDIIVGQQVSVASARAIYARLVEAGFGMTLMPEIAAKTELDAAPGLRLHRFGAPEPARQIGLVRRAGTPGSGWAAQLAETLKDVGEGLTGQLRAKY